MLAPVTSLIIAEMARGQPPLARLAATPQNIKYLLQIAIRRERIVDAKVNRQLRKALQFVVWTEHQHFDAGHHARHCLVRGLRKSLLAEIEKHHVGAVAKHQHLEMVVPHFREQRRDENSPAHSGFGPHPWPVSLPL